MAQTSAASAGSEAQSPSLRVRVQKFGSFLSGMVMPNIGAFIAWGLITAIFIPDGWYPNERLAQLVDPMILYLLPLLIAYTGGRIVYGARGGVVGAIATIGAIVGSDIPMFLGALIMGPLGGYLIMKFDDLVAHRVRQGFEMLVKPG
jgi:PTS system mannitol-specific IIC component